MAPRARGEYPLQSVSKSDASRPVVASPVPHTVFTRLLQVAIRIKPAVFVFWCSGGVAACRFCGSSEGTGCLSFLRLAQSEGSDVRALFSPHDRNDR